MAVSWFARTEGDLFGVDTTCQRHEFTDAGLSDDEMEGCSEREDVPTEEGVLDAAPLCVHAVNSARPATAATTLIRPLDHPGGARVPARVVHGVVAPPDRVTHYPSMSTEGNSSSKTAKAVLVGAAMVALAILAAAGALVASAPSGVDIRARALGCTAGLW
jgi:hypothetical protein